MGLPAGGRLRPIVLSLLCAGLCLGQGKATVFFPTEDGLESLAEELEELVALRRAQPARERAGDFINALLAKPAVPPMGRSPAHAVSPWLFLGKLWPDLADDIKRDIRRRIADALAASHAPALAARAFFSLPDPELRGQIGPDVLFRLLEAGETVLAEQGFRMLAAGTSGDAAVSFAVAQAAATAIAAPGRTPELPSIASSDPEIVRLYLRIRAEAEAAPPRPMRAGPWSSLASSASPGSIKNRFSLHQDVGWLGGGDEPFDAHFLVVVDTNAYAFNGTEALALDTASGKSLWRRKLGSLRSDLRNVILAPTADRSSVYVAAPERLVRLDAASGEIAWSRFLDVDRDGGGVAWVERQPERPPPAFLTPPLLAAGKLFVGVVLPEVSQTAAYLSAISPDTGTLLWLTKVGSSEARDFLGLGSSPLPLLAWGGRVYFCPNLGFLAAVDAEDGAIAFLRTYPRLDVLAAEYSIRRETRWRLSPPAVWRTSILIAPQDTNELLAIELREGGIELAIPRERGDYFLGPARNRIYLVGSTLRAIQLDGPQPGLTVFATPLPDARPGRGGVFGGVVAIPFRDRLLLFDADTGTTLSTHLWETPRGGGNMLAVPEGILVAHERGVDLYRHLAEDLAEIETFAQPSELRRLRRAYLDLKVGDFSAALPALAAYLENAVRYASPEETRERMNVAQLLGAWLELDLPAQIELTLSEFRARDRLALGDQDAVQALVTRGELFERLGDLRGALDAYYRAVGRAYAALTRGLRIELSVAWDLRIEAVPYLTAKIGGVLERSPAPADLLAEFDAQARAELARADPAPHVQALQTVMRSYPFTQTGQAAFIKCARVYLESQNSLAAKDILSEYLNTNPRGPFALDALAALARIFEGGQQIREAVRTYERIDADFGDAEIEREGRRTKAGAWAAERLAALATRTEPDRAPPLRLPLKLMWYTRSDLIDRPSSLRFLPTGRENPDRYVLVRGDDFLHVYRGDSGRLEGAVVAPASLRDAALIRQGDRDVLVLAGRSAILGTVLPGGDGAFDPIVIGEPDDPQTYLTAITFLPAAMVCLAGDVLSRFEASGQRLWQRRLPRRGRAPLVAAGNAVVSFAATGMQAFVTDMDTGADVGTISIASPDQRCADDPVAIGDGRIAVVSASEAFLVDARSRAVAWRRNLERVLPQRCRYLPEHPDRLYIWGRQQQISGCRLMALRAADGAVLWNKYFSKADEIFQIAADGDDLILLCGDPERVLIALSVSQTAVTERWRRKLYRVLDEDAQLLVSGGSVFHGSLYDNRLVAVATRTGYIQDESMRAVRNFLLEGRMLRDYRRDGDQLFVLTESGLAAFRFYDAYQTGRSKESLILTAIGGQDPPDRRALDVSYELGQQLLVEGDPLTALRFLDRVLWEKWPRPEEAPDLWFLMGAAQEAEARQERFIIPCLPAPPGIAVDGYLSEPWPIGTAVQLGSPRAVVPIQGRGPGGHGTMQPIDELVPPWEGPDDLSATFFCAWDAANFYFAVDVRDDVVLPHDAESERWIGDCLIIDLDTEGDGGHYPGPDDQMLTLYLTVKQPKRDEEDSRKPKGQYKVRVNEDRAGLIYEVAIPWTSLGFDGTDRKLAAGASAFGLNVLVVDDDGPSGARQAISLNASHLLSWKRDRAWEGFVPNNFPHIVIQEHGGAEGMGH